LEYTQELCKKYLPSSLAQENAFWTGFLSGAAAESTSALFYVPSDLIAQRLQVQNTKGFAHNCR